MKNKPLSDNQRPITRYKVTDNCGNSIELEFDREKLTTTTKNLRRWLNICIVGWTITLLAGLALLWSAQSITAPSDFGSAYSETDYGQE